MHLAREPWTTPSLMDGFSTANFVKQRNAHGVSPSGYGRKGQMLDPPRSKTPSGSLPPSRPGSQQALTRPSNRQGWSPTASQFSSFPSSPAMSKTLPSSLPSRPGSQQSRTRPSSNEQGCSPNISQQSAISGHALTRSMSSPSKKRQDFVGYGDPWLKQAKMLTSYFAPSKAWESPLALRKHLQMSKDMFEWDNSPHSSGWPKMAKMQNQLSDSPEAPSLGESPTSQRARSKQKNMLAGTSTFLEHSSSLKKGQASTPKSEFTQKKANAAKALAQDRCRIDQQLAKAKERSLLEDRQRRDYEMKLARCFNPIEEPHKHIPPPWQELDITNKATREHKFQRTEHWLNLDMTPEQLGALANLCTSFAHLMRPYTDDQVEGEKEAPFLTRPAFCRLLIELNLGDVHGELMYHDALDMFDALSSHATLRGCSMVAGQVSGLWVDEYDDKTLQLFTSLFSMIITEAQELASRLTIDDLKDYVFNELIVRAEKKCRKRTRQMSRQMAQGKSMFRVPLNKPPLALGGASLGLAQPPEVAEHDRQSLKRDSFDSQENGKTGKVEALVKLAAGKLAGKRGSIMLRRRSVQLTDKDASQLIVPKEDDREEEDAFARSKHEESMEYQQQNIDNSDSRKTGQAPGNVPTSTSTPEDSDKEQDPEEVLYAHTNRVSKGEYLTNMLLEPEVMHLIWMFYDCFSTLFETYTDVSTEFMQHVAHGGHLSQEGFLRFCIDFGLFPELVDLNSLCCFLVSAESTQEVSRNYIKSRVQKDKSFCPFEAGSIVQIIPRSTLQGKRESSTPGDTVKPGEPLKVLALDFTDVDAEAAFLVTQRGRKLWARLWDIELSSKPFFAKPGPDKKEQAFRALWINKPIDDMTPGEQKGLTILAAFSDFMATNKLRSKDFFGRFDEDESGCIGVDELFKGVTFMCLGGTLRTSSGTPPPSPDEVQTLFDLIDEDGGGSLDYRELDIVIKTVQERKARHGKENIFLKESADMTDSELAATDFFVPLYHILEARNWTASDLIKEFDRDCSGELSSSECLAAGTALGIKPSEDTVHNFDKALMLLDSNFDGGLSEKELQQILDFVRDSIKSGEEFEIPNPFLAEVLAKKQDTMVSVFGLKTFIETIMKIGLGYLCFHGTPEQSTLPVTAKVVWIFTYLQWQLTLPSKEEPPDSQVINKKLATALQTFGNCRASLSDVLKEFAQKGYKPKNMFEEESQSTTLDAKKTLQEDEPDLFRQGATEEPILFGEDMSREEDKACDVCGFVPVEGWGNPSCSLCGHGDAILKACLINARDNLPALQKVVTLMGTSKKPKTHNQIVRNQDKEKNHLLRALSAWTS
eukprot:TRINITY_DN24069_c0_g1_i1.p1 TRINITY_DN24069_c0_g1~~TRINITY_DN24069_c0_g1_i1.p1  ORF type:complete len:1326 (+),score=257.20 TRINITY_DN24069_c0_g1_i1:52-4029(+)